MPKPEKLHKQHKVELNLESSVPCKLSEPIADLVTEMVIHVVFFKLDLTVQIRRNKTLNSFFLM